ncbi:contractile injection system tape measure protein [Rheinheimera nanhaiensis]|uniref:Uncharacterized protein n=1 Tax=Rheinheimera nanhaiensis E407-8 TaxID=562729 RepID=I1DZJ9_9GAMM|nr:contractile injection system tape measure protein [Rheinheimera nanhaiensis]GAB59477.1 hypothetical protein RNAN_2483 [Rheinheimera nanhaiensis E407-8]
MHRLTEIELDFNCSTLNRAQWFNASAEHLLQHELLPVAQQVLDEFDLPQQVQLAEISLQLPPLCLPADRYLLQQSFRQALRTQLWLLLPGAAADSRQAPGLSASMHHELIRALTAADSQALLAQWPLYLKYAAELVAILRQLAAQGDLCSQLAFGLSSQMLAQLVQLLAPGEQRFILQLMAQPQLFTAAVPISPQLRHSERLLAAPALRQRQRHLWQLSLSYLLVDRGSRFNRQSYLHYLLQRMAAHDNISLQQLVQHMLQTLADSQRYFAAQSPLLLQLTALLLPLLPDSTPQQRQPATAQHRGPAPAYACQRLALPLSQLPPVARQRAAATVTTWQGPLGRSTKLQHVVPGPARYWQQLLALLRQQRLSVAQQRQLNVQLQLLLQQNSSLWLDSMRLQLQRDGLLPVLVDYTQPQLLQRLFQQLQAASVAAMTPYISLLQHALSAISLPLPLLHRACWQPLLQAALQRQPLTLEILLQQLHLWLRAKSGALAARRILQQLALQLQGDSTSAASAAARQQGQAGPLARLWQQIHWQLAVSSPWTSPIQPLPLQQRPLAAVHNVSLLSKRPQQHLPVKQTQPLLLQMIPLLLAALPPQAHSRAQAICQQLCERYSLPVPGSASAAKTGAARPPLAESVPTAAEPQGEGAANAEPLSAGNAGASLLASALLQQLAQALAPDSRIAFYRTLQCQLAKQPPLLARQVLLRQLRQLLQLAGANAAAGQAAVPCHSSVLVPQPLTPVAKAEQHSGTAVTAEAKAAQQPNPLLARQAAAQPEQAQATQQDTDSALSWQPVINAGLVLAAPYLPLLWQRLGYLQGQRFASVQQAWQACALLHYMASGDTAAAPQDYWQQWRLSMLLNGCEPPCPGGLDLQLRDSACELADSLLCGIIAQWPKLASSSVSTLRECFLQRSGSLCQLGNGTGWQLQLQSGPYDMLLDGLPWSFSLIRYHWMQGELYVHWRG